MALRVFQGYYLEFIMSFGQSVGSYSEDATYNHQWEKEK